MFEILFVVFSNSPHFGVHRLCTVISFSKYKFWYDIARFVMFKSWNNRERGLYVLSQRNAPQAAPSIRPVQVCVHLIGCFLPTVEIQSSSQVFLSPNVQPLASPQDFLSPTKLI